MSTVLGYVVFSFLCVVCSAQQSEREKMIQLSFREFIEAPIMKLFSEDLNYDLRSDTHKVNTTGLVRLTRKLMTILMSLNGSQLKAYFDMLLQELFRMKINNVIFESIKKEVKDMASKSSVKIKKDIFDKWSLSRDDDKTKNELFVNYVELIEQVDLLKFDDYVMLLSINNIIEEEPEIVKMVTRKLLTSMKFNKYEE